MKYVTLNQKGCCVEILFYQLNVFSSRCSFGWAPNGWKQMSAGKVCCKALEDGKGFKGKEKEGVKVRKEHNEGRQEAGWESTRERERVGEKPKETDVENHLGMDECSW